MRDIEITKFSSLHYHHVSKADRDITDRLKAALALIDVKVLDHFVIGADEVTSLAELGGW